MRVDPRVNLLDSEMSREASRRVVRTVEYQDPFMRKSWKWTSRGMLSGIMERRA